MAMDNTHLKHISAKLDVLIACQQETNRLLAIVARMPAPPPTGGPQWPSLPQQPH